MLSNVLFFMFIILLVGIVIWAIIDDIKKTPIECHYKENTDCECYDQSGVPICENCEFYKMLNERN